MNERIKELAEQAFDVDLSLSVNSRVSVVIKVEHLERFAELVRQDEREACASLCEEVGDKAKDNDGYTIGGYACAKAIRARGGK